MKKKQLIVALATSTIVLAQAGFVSADETTTSPVDGTTPVVVSPAETPVDPTTPTQPSENPTTPPTTNPVVPIDSTTPSSGVTEVTDNNGVTTNHTTEPSTDSKTDTGSNFPDVDKAGGITTDHTVPTTDGGSAQVTPDKTVLTNNPSISADTANHAGASQVGTTSTITGQVVQNVTAQAPVVTNTGATIVSTKDGQLVLSDGSTVTPETVGATTNSDKTITVTKADGTKATLPETGDKARSLLSVLGAGLLVAAGFLAQKVWSRKEEKN